MIDTRDAERRAAAFIRSELIIAHATQEPRVPVFVFVSGPLTKPCPKANAARALEAGSALRRAGYVPFIPHLSLAWEAQDPQHYETWMSWCFAWLSKCDAVVRLPGESSGADREVGYAKRLGLPVFNGVDAFLQRGRP
jgi:nucleoside 2-deoxyribosyltransferase